jgi:hypothetical protein
MRKFFLPVLVALGLFATALPANAAGLQWTDPTGDGQLLLDSALPAVPVPNEPSLDVTKATIERKGDNIVWTVNIDKLAATNPAGSTGIEFEIDFTYGAGEYQLQVIDDIFWGKATEFRGGTLGAADPTPCGKCVAVIDRKASKVTWTTPVSSLSRAIKTADPAAKALAPGAKFEKLDVTSHRTYTIGDPNVTGALRITPTADEATTDKTFVL